MSDTQILIVGAGPTGLVLALQLARRGVPIRIVDKAEGPGRASRAMVVQARTLEFYDQLGLADEMIAAGIRTETIVLREGGRERGRLSLTGMGDGVSPYPFALTYPQDDHEHFLVGKLEAAGVAVEWNTELARFDEGTRDVGAVLRRGGDEERLRCAFLCGCDGGHSTVRRHLGIAFSGGTYDQLFYVADVEVTGDSTEGSMNFGPDTFIFRLPVRSSGMQRLIGVVPADRIPGGDAATSRVTFDDLRAEVEPLIGAPVAAVNWFSTYHVHHRVAGEFRRGRCFLAGDAGHVHSPAGGQGMNTGIGDAVNLGWKLADVVRGRAPDTLLDSYQPERIAFARRLVASTDRGFQAMIGAGAANRLLRTTIAPRLVPLLAAFAPTRRLLFETLSQTRIKYRNSPIAAGRAGRVHGGDRLPWLAVGEDNFAPLRALDWQIHVYGKPSPGLAAATRAIGLPLHIFKWRDATGRAGLRRDAAYLVRPDGHVALAMPRQDATALRAFVAQVGLVFRTPAAEPTPAAGPP